MFIVKYRYIFFLLSGLLVFASALAIGYFGLNLGTDFRGGTILEVEYAPLRPGVAEIQESLATLDLGEILIQPSGEQSVIIRSQTLSDEQKQAVLRNLSEDGKYGLLEKRYSSVGPSLGAELARKGIIAIVIVAVLLLLYIALVFRQVSKPVSSWVYGLVSVIMMVHDVIIPTGIFAILGYYYGIEMDALFLTAFLTILGLSVNDKIVALDRIRENLRRHGPANFPETVGKSLNETMTRSVNTSLTVIFVLLAIFFWGGDTTKYFALAMALGMIVATYSSIFVAAPLLVAWQKR